MLFDTFSNYTVFFCTVETTVCFKTSQSWQCSCSIHSSVYFLGSDYVIVLQPSPVDVQTVTDHLGCARHGIFRNGVHLVLGLHLPAPLLIFTHLHKHHTEVCTSQVQSQEVPHLCQNTHTTPETKSSCSRDHLQATADYLPDPSGVEQTYVGSIFTLASWCVSKQSPLSISRCILFITSFSSSLLSLNSDRICSTCRRTSSKELQPDNKLLITCRRSKGPETELKFHLSPNFHL